MPRRGVTCVGTDRATGSQRAWCAGTHLSWKWHWHLSGWEGKEKKGISRAQHCLMAISRDLLLLLAVCAAGRGRTGHYPVREGQGAAGGSGCPLPLAGRCSQQAQAGAEAMLEPSTRCYCPGRFGNVEAARLDSSKSGGILGSCSLPPSGLAWLSCAHSWLFVSPMRFANF